MTVLTEIPLEFESYLRDKTLQKLPTNLNEFIFAYIPNLDLSVDIDRNSTIPNENLIVHRAPVANVGKTGENAIVYSAIIDSTVPEFTFNAIYLHDKEANTCGMIIHQQDETKQKAMTITKSALMQYDSAAASANVTVDAETWQVDINGKFDQYTLKKDFLRHYAGSGCVDEHTLSETPNNNAGALIFSDSENTLTLNHATYIMSEMIIEVPTQSVTLENLIGDVSRKDFVYVTSNGDFLLYKGTDDSSDPKAAFSKLGFAPVQGDPLLYKKGEIYALAIGFIQRVGDTYFSSKLPSAAPKIEPKLIDCWFDLRLSAHKQDVNLLREKAIRAAVAGELRGKGGVPFCMSTTSVEGGGETTGRILSKIDSNLKIGDFAYIQTSVGYVRKTLTNVNINAKSINWIGSLIVQDYCEVITQSHLAEFDTVPWVDIIGTPENIAAIFPEGVLGQWIPKISNTVVELPLNSKATANAAIVTQNNGDGWVSASTAVDTVKNTIESHTNSTRLIQYKTLSRFTEKSNNSVVIGSVGDVYASSHNSVLFGCRLASSVADIVCMSSSAHRYTVGSNKTKYYLLSIGNKFHDAQSLSPVHFDIVGGCENDSHGVKALSTITEKNGLLYLQLHGCELVHNGTNWGDDSKVPIISGEGTKTDKNGNVVKTFCHHSLLPIGIADSQTLASLKIDNRANISDGINSGLHFDCLDDVPEPIRDFYYEIVDDLGLIRVYKYPHPYESGGHISDESISLWQFHDDFKDWLQTCAEIKFNAAQAGEESERVPLPPMPIKLDYIGE